ncbi:hypothetical protein ACF09J_32380 [Streptomyces sp. NPDC014889]
MRRATSRRTAHGGSTSPCFAGRVAVVTSMFDVNVVAPSLLAYAAS